MIEFLFKSSYACILLSYLFLTSCQSIYFFPSSQYVWNPKLSGFKYESHSLEITESRGRLTIWEIIPVGTVKGSIYFLHGNAENISTHSQSMMWLVNEGYRVFALDYRGFGTSSGSANIDNAIEDILTGFEWLKTKIPQDEKLIVFAQSIGATLSIHAFSEAENADRVSLFIFDSAFSSYSGVVDDKISEVGLFPPFSSLISLIVFAGKYDPLESISKYPKSKVLIVHNEDDPIVNSRHSELLSDKMPKPNYYWKSQTGGHCGYFQSIKHRQELLELL